MFIYTRKHYAHYFEFMYGKSVWILIKLSLNESNKCSAFKSFISSEALLFRFCREYYCMYVLFLMYST